MGAKRRRKKSAKRWQRFSDLGRAGLVVASVGAPAIERDWRGGRDALGSLLTAHAVGTFLKDIFPEKRPDGSDHESFPSTHAADTFGAAASLAKRYGWELGLPLLTVAAAVSLARVLARRHHWYDVAAGAVIGTSAGLCLTSRWSAYATVANAEGSLQVGHTS